MSNLLIVEDDQFVQNLLAQCLMDAGYGVVCVQDGKGMHGTLNKGGIDLILLDLTLPDEDGLTLLRQVRTKFVIPVIVLTSREGYEDRLCALDIGADDYIVKPCGFEELALRVRNVLRRIGRDESIARGTQFNFLGWSLDMSRGVLTAPDGSGVILPQAEYNLLAALAQGAGRVLSRAYLLDAVSGADSDASERMIDVLISRLRQRLEPTPKHPTLIITVPGRGYMFKSL